jgi:hypothetical protein
MLLLLPGERIGKRDECHERGGGSDSFVAAGLEQSLCQGALVMEHRVLILQAMESVHGLHTRLAALEESVRSLAERVDRLEDGGTGPAVSM